MARTKPYTPRGIRRKPCYRCGNPARFQWEICADGNAYRPCCAECDAALNALVLRWANDPEAEAKIAAYHAVVLGEGDV